VDGSFILQALWLFLPAYMANMAPVFAMKLLPDWTARMDGGKVWKDGRPMLGAGKTWRGLAAGVVFASVCAALQSLIRKSSIGWSDFDYHNHGLVGPIVLGAFFGAGAIVGDAVKSFFKRRTGREGGAPWVPFDQLDFVVGGLLFAFLGSWGLQLLPPAAPNWWWTELGGKHWPKLVVLVLLTPALHFVVNVIGYRLKLKKVPW
jgi:CDP-2,3-bis-(O-geranylgeranyl)-sn-glycerol synthase